MNTWTSTFDQGAQPKPPFHNKGTAYGLGFLAMGPKFNRQGVLLLLLILCSVVLWVKFIAPVFEEGRSAWAALDAHSGVGGTFVSNGHSRFPGILPIKQLDPSLLPQSSNEKSAPTSKKQRLVFVGDIHGCKDELEKLLKKVRFHTSTDHLVSVGDIVSKGPDSSGVIDLLHRHKASCVRGNHDDRVLLVAQSLQARTSETDKDSVQVEADGIDPVEKLAKSLSNHQLEYLQSCPIILRIGHLKAFNTEAVVVHGGLIPGLALESQDPVSAMNMRVIDLSTHIPSSKHKLKGSRAWYKLWNRYQQLLSLHPRLGKHKGGRQAEKQLTVIYGHDARQGLQIHKYTKGLDSGCVGGGKLTALVVDGDGKQQIVQVKAKNHRMYSATRLDVLRDGGPQAPPDGKKG